MAKQFNGVCRAWMKVRQADPKAPPLIGGQCVVHLSNPEFYGNVLHTAGVLEIAAPKATKIAATRNNCYAMLGTESVMAADCGRADRETVGEGEGVAGGVGLGGGSLVDK